MTASRTYNRVDRNNCLIILISAALAVLLPFKLFIFSYVVLGPLHYLTEMTWLKKKKFFSQQDKWVWTLAALTLLVVLGFYATRFDFLATQQAWIAELLSPAPLIAMALLLSVGMVFIKSSRRMFLWALLVLLVGMFSHIFHLLLQVLLFVPNLIHVYLFTFLFMLVGTLEKKSKWGHLSLILMLIIPLLLYLLPIGAFPQSRASLSVVNFIEKSGFENLHHALGVGWNSASLIKIQIFLAFSFTYHYLNWFSKVKVIRWHQVERGKLVTILFFWVALMLLFYCFYEVGLVLLFSLSLLHVFLEFPLNVQSVKLLFSRVRS